MEPLSREEIDLGAFLGHHEAFGLIAGRCSAIQAHTLRHLREQKLYRRSNLNWSEFCSTFLQMSKTQADLAIRLLDEFGPGFFEISQIAPISAETYRALAPAVRDGILHLDGEAIPILHENAREISAAIASLRRSAAAARAARAQSLEERLKDIAKRCDRIVADLRRISKNERCGEHWMAVVAALQHARAALERLASPSAGASLDLDNHG